MENQIKYKSVDEYMSSLPTDVRVKMEVIRTTVKAVAPEAVELLSYNMPAFKYQGRILIYYMAHRAHIGFYPSDAKVVGLFSDELVNYSTSKGTIQLPLDKKLPAGLIRKIVKYRVKTISELNAHKGKKNR